MSNLVTNPRNSHNLTKQTEKFKVDGNPILFQQFLLKSSPKDDARKNNPKIKDEAPDKALSKLADIGHKPKKTRHENFKNQHQSASSNATEDKKSPSETVALPADLMLTKIQININYADFLLNTNSELHSKISTTQSTPMTDLITQLVNQINIQACDSENSTFLKISFNQETLPATILTLQQTSNGWKLDFNTSSVFSYRQIDQHLDFLRQRFEQRRLGAISTNLNLYSPLLKLTKENHENHP